MWLIIFLLCVCLSAKPEGKSVTPQHFPFWLFFCASPYHRFAWSHVSHFHLFTHICQQPVSWLQLLMVCNQHAQYFNLFINTSLFNLCMPSCYLLYTLPLSISLRSCSTAHYRIVETVYSTSFRLGGHKDIWEKCFGFCKPYLSVAMWYWCGFKVLNTNEICLPSCQSLWYLFWNWLPWYYFPFAMSNKDSLILAPEEPAEVDEGQQGFLFVCFIFATLDVFLFCIYTLFIFDIEWVCVELTEKCIWTNQSGWSS